jgi:DNA polymerase III alpha subunit
MMGKEQGSVYLNCQSSFTPDAVGSIEAYAQAVKLMGMEALGITDRTRVSWQFQQKFCGMAGIGPVFGLEVDVYFADPFDAESLRFLVETDDGFASLHNFAQNLGNNLDDLLSS